MQNNELLELINLSMKNGIKVDVLRQLLKLVEQDGKISPKKVKQIKELLSKKDINDSDLLNIYKKAYQKRVSWDLISSLNNHPLIKSYLNYKDFSLEEWKLILEFVNTLPFDIITDSLYIKWLRYICENNDENQTLNELPFFHEIFKESLNTPFVYYNWYFEYLLDNTKSLESRRHILSLLSKNIFNILKEKIEIKDIDRKAKKIIKCYELYGLPFTSLYATIITCKKDMDIPVIDKQECEIYMLLYKMMCSSFMSETVIPNFITSLYYKIATNQKTPVSKRLEFMNNLTEKELILKDNLVYKLWVTYNLDGLIKMKVLKYALLNNGIRTNPLCRTFLMQEESLSILEVASSVFKNNRVRKDRENLSILCGLEKSGDKIKLLHVLEEKYQDDLTQKQAKEQENEEKKLALLKAYQDFFNKKIGLEKLKNSLEDAKELDIDLVRIREKKR